MKGHPRRRTPTGARKKVVVSVVKHQRGAERYDRAGHPAVRSSHCQPSHADASLRRINAALEAQARSIGQALHDQAAQLLTAAFSALAEATELVPAPARTRLAEVKVHLDAIEEEFRRVAHELRPRILEDLGLVPALRFLADGLGIRTGISVTSAIDIDGPLPIAVETAVYRLVQEAFANIAKHADAHYVVLELAARSGVLTCCIRDDGVGVRARQRPESGLGLIGIHDRVNVLGGTLTIDSAPERGVAVTVTIPLEESHVYTRPARRRSSNRA